MNNTSAELATELELLKTKIQEHQNAITTHTLQLEQATARSKEVVAELCKQIGVPVPEAPKASRKRHKCSAEGVERIRQAQLQRWATHRAKKAAEAEATTATTA